MMTTILALNCFTNTSVIYRQQTQELEISGLFNQALSLVDKQSCDVFIGESIKVYIQIGDLVFQSDYQMYNPTQLVSSLSKTVGDLTKINQFSVASFTISTKENNIQQAGISIHFSTRIFDRTNCFKNVNMLYNASTNEVILQKVPQILCDFQTDGAVESTVFVRIETQYEAILTVSLANNYVDWFLTNTTCDTPSCTSYIQEFQSLLVPLGYYNVKIPQKFTKKTQAYAPQGSLVEQDTEFTINLVLRQPITQFMSQEQIPTISDPIIRPLYKSIELKQTITPSPSELYEDYDEFLIKICVAASNSNSSDSYCFAHSDPKFHSYETFTFRCDQQKFYTYEECIRRLLVISNYPDTQIGIVFYDMYKNDVMMESFKYYSTVMRNSFSHVVLTCTSTYACIQFTIRESFIIQQRIDEFILQWTTSAGTHRLSNVFKYPNAEGQYCFPSNISSLNELTDKNTTEFIIYIGNQYLFINSVDDLICPEIFTYGIITMFVLFILIGGGLLLIMLLRTRLKK
ncbi:hypothetical protein SS50377_21793 [Spironucleus salmonicida]|uniref:Transmembrane protein n=1 Tax=Spironucleus salmonicida TaxID=348837 RepID=V6LML6_9EUKA|nr:hypothetical protein SS50377_21793 [Spironucleus salmonicida]|eukprot:EST45458.1 Hypothetical protein SS50377_14612 [Spironucleus salmonicida]